MRKHQQMNDQFLIKSFLFFEMNFKNNSEMKFNCFDRYLDGIRLFRTRKWWNWTRKNSLANVRAFRKPIDTKFAIYFPSNLLRDSRFSFRSIGTYQLISFLLAMHKKKQLLGNENDKPRAHRRTERNNNGHYSVNAIWSTIAINAQSNFNQQNQQLTTLKLNLN